jgi:DNA repair exonuclease SbcCD ATPase subunit
MNKQLGIINEMKPRKIELANVNDLNEARKKLLAVGQELDGLANSYQRAEFEYRKQSTNIQQEIADFVKQKEANLAKLTEFINKGKNEIKQQVDDVKSALTNTEKVVMEVEQTAKDLGVPMPIPVKEAKQLIDSIGSLVRNVNSYVR